MSTAETNPKPVEMKENDFSKLIQTSDGPIPFLKDLWSFFSLKGVKTSFFSVNPENSFELDLLISEGLGCPIHILTNKESVEHKWAIISKTLKARAIQEEDKELTWLKGVEKKWILPKNIQIHPDKLTWSTWFDQIHNISENRIDICKIEGNLEDERVLLYSLLESGFRPGVLVVRYSEDPDANVPSMLIAGHLQMSGYKLVDCMNNWFFYTYDDICFYDACSWRTTFRETKVANPLVKYFVDSVQEKQKQIEEYKKQTEANAQIQNTLVKENLNEKKLSE